MRGMTNTPEVTEVPITGSQEIGLDEVSSYLAPFSGTYSGYGRQGNVRVTSVVVSEDASNESVTVEARDPDLGRFRVTLTGVQVKSDPAAGYEAPYLGDPDSDD